MNEEMVSINVEQLIRNVTPECIEAWEGLKQCYGPHFTFAADAPGWLMEAGTWTVRFRERTLHMIWLLGFASFHALEANAGVLFLLPQPFDTSAVSQMPGQAEVDTTLGLAMTQVEHLNQVETIGQFYWPPNVPEPGHTLKTKLDKAAYDLNCMALAFILLHEMQHIMFARDNNAPADPHIAEHACDRFARDFMTKRIDAYAASSGYPCDKVVSKRAMGMALAMFVMLVLTPRDRWAAGNETHPPIVSRLSTLFGGLNLLEADPFWIYTASLLVGVLKIEQRLPKQLSFDHPKDLCHQLVGIIQGE